MGSLFGGCFNFRKSWKPVDPLQWSTSIGRHQYGEFSFAVEQANTVLEDYSQIESFPNGTFIGIYDGHGGPETAQYVCDHLFPNFAGRVAQNEPISQLMLNATFQEIENGFINLVRQTMQMVPMIKGVGSCCLIGLIRNGILYVANLGDSRAVLGSVAQGAPKTILVSQLTLEHNASNALERAELLRNAHPQDRNVVVLVNDVWRVKGKLAVTRAFGDAYLKDAEFAFREPFNRFILRDPIIQPVVRVDPHFNVVELDHNSKFVIFASDGLWDLLTNEQAANIVHKYPRKGIAKRLIKAGLKRVREVRELTSKAFNDIRRGDRRVYHDDITVIVVFLDHLVPNLSVPRLSLRGYGNAVVGPEHHLNAPPPPSPDNEDDGAPDDEDDGAPDEIE